MESLNNSNTKKEKKAEKFENNNKKEKMCIINKNEKKLENKECNVKAFDQNSETNEKNESSKKEISNRAIYLGLHIIESIRKIYDLIEMSLKGILQFYPDIEDANILLKLLESGTLEENENYNMPWRYPKDTKKWHITSLFKKGKSFDKSKPSYQNFEEKKSISVEVRGIVYIPERIITSLIFTDTAIENEFPHMTTLLGSYAPKNSNDVCKELFSKGQYLDKEYSNMIKNELSSETFVQKVYLKLFNKNEVAYVFKFPNSFILESEMAVFYN